MRNQETSSVQLYDGSTVSIRSRDLSRLEFMLNALSNDATKLARKGLGEHLELLENLEISESGMEQLYDNANAMVAEMAARRIFYPLSEHVLIGVEKEPSANLTR